MMPLARIGLMLALLGVPGCGGDSNSGDGGSVGNATGACASLLAHCPTGYSWSYYISDETMCRGVFECVHDLYTGDCRERMEQLVDCGAAVTDPSGCDGCDSIAVSVMEDCPYPADCF